MSILESLMVLLHGGPPTFTCESCKKKIRGDETGAGEPVSGKYWCRPCNAAGLAPDWV